MIRRRPFIVLLAVAAALTLAPVVLDGETEDMDENARRGTAGAYLALDNSMVHFELAGPPDGPPVVLIHGASGPMDVWDKTFITLRDEGFHVLRYDLYGRGSSDRPDAAYDDAFYQRQLDGLLVATKLAAVPVHVVGSSMGAIVAAGLSTRRPKDVRSVTLIGPAGFPIVASPAAAVLAVPLVGEYALRVLGDWMLPSHNRRYYRHPDAVPEAHAAFARQMRYRGYKRAILATMRHMPMSDYQDGYARLGALRKPTLLIWGEEDVTFPFAHHDKAQKLLGNAEFLPVPEAGHVPQYEKPAVVGARLVAFLRAN